MTVTFAPDRILFVVSQPYLSRRREQALCAALTAASPIQARCIRLEGTGVSLPDALDALVGEGGRAILVQPLGLPFSDSIAAWLPGALAHWQKGRDPGITLRLGEDLAASPALARVAAQQALDGASEAQDPAHARPSLGPRGWDEAGDQSDHLLVCAGPRCHFRGAPRLRVAVQDALRQADGLRACQVTESSCLGPCNRGPLVAHYPAGTWYTVQTPEDIDRVIAAVLGNKRAADHLVAHRLSQPVRPEPA